MNKPLQKLAVSGLALFVILTAAGSALGADDSLWMTDFEKAQQKAQKENKDLLLDFTGSDWCGWCIKLDKEVFSKKEFKEKAPNDFVLVKLDFPRTKEQSEEIKQQNAKLQQKYAVQGFPTIVLADADGDAYARTGYRPGGAEKYLTHLDELQEVKKKIEEMEAKADKAKGLEKAKILDKLVVYQTDNDIPADVAVYKRIVKLDPKNEAGLKDKYTAKIALIEAQPELEKASRARDSKKVLEIVDKLLEEHKFADEDKQELMFIKAATKHQAGEKEGATKLLKEARKLAPDTALAQRIGFILQQLEKQEEVKEGAGK
ncbi:MAG: thioredoxin family protein [Phycisphaerae bacterium]